MLEEGGQSDGGVAVPQSALATAEGTRRSEAVSIANEVVAVFLCSPAGAGAGGALPHATDELRRAVEVEVAACHRLFAPVNAARKRAPSALAALPLPIDVLHRGPLSLVVSADCVRSLADRVLRAGFGGVPAPEGAVASLQRTLVATLATVHRQARLLTLAEPTLGRLFAVSSGCATPGCAASVALPPVPSSLGSMHWMSPRSIAFTERNELLWRDAVATRLAFSFWQASSPMLGDEHAPCESSLAAETAEFAAFGSGCGGLPLLPRPLLARNAFNMPLCSLAPYLSPELCAFRLHSSASVTSMSGDSRASERVAALSGDIDAPLSVLHLPELLSPADELWSVGCTVLAYALAGCAPNSTAVPRGAVVTALGCDEAAAVLLSSARGVREAYRGLRRLVEGVEALLASNEAGGNADPNETLIGTVTETAALARWLVDRYGRDFLVELCELLTWDREARWVKYARRQNALGPAVVTGGRRAERDDGGTDARPLLLPATLAPGVNSEHLPLLRCAAFGPSLPPRLMPNGPLFVPLESEGSASSGNEEENASGVAKGATRNGSATGTRVASLSRRARSAVFATAGVPRGPSPRRVVAAAFASWIAAVERRAIATGGVLGRPWEARRSAAASAVLRLLLWRVRDGAAAAMALTALAADPHLTPVDSWLDTVFGINVAPLLQAVLDSPLAPVQGGRCAMRSSKSSAGGAASSSGDPHLYMSVSAKDIVALAEGALNDKGAASPEIAADLTPPLFGSSFLDHWLGEAGRKWRLNRVNELAASLDADVATTNLSPTPNGSPSVLLSASPLGGPPRFSSSPIDGKAGKSGRGGEASSLLAELAPGATLSSAGSAIANALEQDAAISAESLTELRTRLLMCGLWDSSSIQSSLAAAALRTALRAPPFGGRCVPPILRLDVWAALLCVPPAAQRDEEWRTWHAVASVVGTGSDRQIALDVPRCMQYSPVFAASSGQRRLFAVLRAWAARHPRWAYWQGADSVCAVVLSLAPDDDPLAFAVFTRVVGKFVPHFYAAAAAAGSALTSTTAGAKSSPTPPSPPTSFRRKKEGSGFDSTLVDAAATAELIVAPSTVGIPPPPPGAPGGERLAATRSRRSSIPPRSASGSLPGQHARQLSSRDLRRTASNLQQQQQQLVQQHQHQHPSAGASIEDRLSLVSHLLQYHDPVLATHLSHLDCRGEHFAVSWLLTLFAHSLPLEKTLRVWDAMFLSGVAEFSACVVVASVLALRNQLLQAGDFCAAVAVLSGSVLASLPLDEVLSDAEWIVRATPPSILMPRAAFFAMHHMHRPDHHNQHDHHAGDSAAAAAPGTTRFTGPTGQHKGTDVLAHRSSPVALLAAEDLHAAMVSTRERSVRESWFASGIIVVDARPQPSAAASATVSRRFELAGAVPVRYDPATREWDRGALHRLVESGDFFAVPPVDEEVVAAVDGTDEDSDRAKGFFWVHPSAFAREGRSSGVVGRAAARQQRPHIVVVAEDDTDGGQGGGGSEGTATLAFATAVGAAEVLVVELGAPNVSLLWGGVSACYMAAPAALVTNEEAAIE